MSSISKTTFILESLFGVVVFSSLFFSGFGVIEKVFFGSAFLTLVLLMDIYSLQTDRANENYSKIIINALFILEDKLDGEKAEKMADFMESYLSQKQLEEVSFGFGFLASISLRFGIWIGFSYLIFTFWPS